MSMKWVILLALNIQMEGRRYPQFMDTHPYAITSADELHGRILYKRPNGSLSPDRDPPGVTIN